MPKRDPLLVEQDHHQKAFAIYAAMGPKRSCQKVAAQMGVSVAAVRRWSQSFGWAKRVGEHDAEIARRIADRIISEASAQTERNLKIVRAAMMRLAKAIADGNIKMQLGDIDRLIRLEEHLLGTPGAQPQSETVHIYLPDNGRLPQTWAPPQGDATAQPLRDQDDRG
jgi:hypothetical protein